MDQAELQAKIDKVSESIVLVDSKDSKALNGIHGFLNDIARVGEASGLQVLAENAKKAGKLIERVIIDNPPNADRLLQQIGTIVSSLQSDLRDAQAPQAGSPAQKSAPVPLTMENFENMAKEDALPQASVGGILEPPLPDFGGGEAPGKVVEAVPMPKEPEPAADDFDLSDEPPCVRQTAAGVILPPNVDIDIFTEFLSRQPSNMDELEADIMELDSTRSAEIFNKVKRTIHTLKGEAGLLALNDVQKLCHTTESFLEEGGMESAGLVDILLAVKDWLSRTFTAFSSQGVNPGPVNVLMELLFETKWKKPEEEEEEAAPAGANEAEPAAQESEVPAAAVIAVSEEPAPEEAPAVSGQGSAGPAEVFLNVADVDLLTDFISEATEHLENVENCMLTIETDPGDENALNTIFRAFHTIKGVAGYLALEQVGHLAHDTESLLDMARKGDIVLQGNVSDILFESVDMMKQLVADVKDALTNSTPLPYEPGVNGLLENLRQIIHPKSKAKGVKPSPAKPIPAQPSQAQPSPKKQEKEIRPAEEKIMETAKSSSAASPASAVPVQKAEAQKPAAAVPGARAPEGEQAASGSGFVEMHESIKVDADRLDKLVDTIGELVITESMVSQMMRDKYSDSNMMGSLSQLDKITRQLQEMSTSLRMIPVRTTFQKMARLVRDLAKKSGKTIDFIMNGEDTELDKTVVDKIGDPLIHMIRNSVDHGIESAADRVKAGKSQVGRVELRAFHKGGNIYIEVLDDGHGLDRERILAKAVENGMISEGASLSEKEIFGLIFQPGFSTAQVVTDISGRGIGMDVVRRNIELLRGRIEIQSTPGQGSIFSIRLPLTLAIIDGMMVGVGEERYIIPTLSIVRSLRPVKEDFSTVQGRGEMYSLDGQMIPTFYLHRLFGAETTKENLEDGLLVVVENDGLFTGLVVDELYGQHQIVIKTLGKLLQGIPGISGSTIMTDGRVALILDIAGLVKLANRERLSGIFR
jgi:two-component system, chemotaxis family, sensor kinase CheA